jgi:hypothetical protein
LEQFFSIADASVSRASIFHGSICYAIISFGKEGIIAMPTQIPETNQQTDDHAARDLPKVTRLPQAFPRQSSKSKVEAILGPRGAIEEALLTHALETSDLDPHRNPIFELLVKGENDVTGLLAYGLYKQNKRDWLIAFQANNNRSPDQNELAAFILAERIPRRIMTYRHLAENMLSRDGYKLSGAKAGLFGIAPEPANDTKALTASLSEPSKRSQTLRYLLGMLILVIAMAVIFRVAGAWLFGTPGK